jgi:RecB family endonuclease NucS
MGWHIQETDTEVRLVPPDASISASELDAVLGNAGDEAEDTDHEEGQAFGLEYQLRDFLAENIQTVLVNANKLKLFVDQTGRDGFEYPTAIGLVDILAVDEEENFYVFELKRSRGSDKVVGQVTRYMGWVNETIGKGKKVTGIIVAKSIDEKMKYAASVIPNVFLFEYEVEFHLKEANAIGG